MSEGGYSREIIEEAWAMGQPIPGNDDGLWRKDEFGAWINRMDYGNRNSQYGWEVADLGIGGGGGGASLRPMQWQNYLDHGSSGSHISSDGLQNTRSLF